MPNRKWNFTREAFPPEHSVLKDEKKIALKGFPNPDNVAYGGLIQNSIANRAPQSRQDQKKINDLKMKKAWALAKQPAGSIFTNGLMMWLTGSSLNLFSISITIWLVFNPVKAIFSTSTVFSKFENPNQSLIGPKVLFILVQLFLLGMGLYKCYVLGLLPINDADWVSNLPVKKSLETLVGFG